MKTRLKPSENMENPEAAPTQNILWKASQNANFKHYSKAHMRSCPSTFDHLRFYLTKSCTSTSRTLSCLVSNESTTGFPGLIEGQESGGTIPNFLQRF